MIRCALSLLFTHAALQPLIRLPLTTAVAPPQGQRVQLQQGRTSMEEIYAQQAQVQQALMLQAQQGFGMGMGVPPEALALLFQSQGLPPHILGLAPPFAAPAAQAAACQAPAAPNGTHTPHPPAHAPPPLDTPAAVAAARYESEGRRSWRRGADARVGSDGLRSGGWQCRAVERG